MDWEFEVAKGDELSKVIADSFAPTFEPGGWLGLVNAKGQDWQVGGDAYALDVDGAMTSYGYDNGYDTGGGYDSGGGTYDPNFPPGGGGGGDPDPDPGHPPLPTTFDPANPIGPLFDYSTLIDEEIFTYWMQAMGGYVDQQIGSWHHHDSLEQFMHGEWLFDMDPELLDYGYDQGYGSSYTEYGQYSPISYVGIPGGGGLVPIFSEWTEGRDLGLLPGDTINSFEVIHHTTFMGFERSGIYQVASLGDPFDFLGRVSGVLDALDLQSAWEDLEEAMNGLPNTGAMGQPYFTIAGDLAAPVSLNGVFIGNIVVTDGGFSLYDANNNLIRHELPLTQHWNQLDGVIFREQMAHQERTTGVPFARGLVTFASVAAGGLLGLGFWQGLGFNFASDVINGGSSASATAYARLLEAAYELRAYQLRNR